MPAKKATSKTARKSNAKSKTMVSIKFHLTWDEYRPLAFIVKWWYYDSELKNHILPLDDPFNQVLQKTPYGVSGIGAVDVFCKHPKINDFRLKSILNSNTRGIVFTDPIYYVKKEQIKKNSKKNESLLWDCIFEATENKKNYEVDVHINLISLQFDNILTMRFSNIKISPQPTSIRPPKKSLNSNSNSNNNNAQSVARTWECNICTTINKVTNNKCEMCDSEPITLRNKKQENNNDNNNDNNNEKNPKTLVSHDSTVSIANLLSSSDEEDEDLSNNTNTNVRKRKLKDMISDDSDDNDDNDNYYDNRNKKQPLSKRQKCNNTKSDEKEDNNNNSKDMNSENKNVKGYKSYNYSSNSAVSQVVLISQMESRHVFLVKQTFHVESVEDYRVMLMRMASCKSINVTMGCEPIGRITGCGSKTTAKKYQKLYIKFKLYNEERLVKKLPEIALLTGCNTSLIDFIFDIFKDKISNLVKTVNNPGDDYPKVNCKWWTKGEVDEQLNLMKQRVKILKTWKKMCKAVGMSQRK